MSKENPKDNSHKHIPEVQKPTTREAPNLNESNQRDWRGSADNIEKGINRRPTMEHPIPTPPSKNNKEE